MFASLRFKPGLNVAICNTFLITVTPRGERSTRLIVEGLFSSCIYLCRLCAVPSPRPLSQGLLHLVFGRRLCCSESCGLLLHVNLLLPSRCKVEQTTCVVSSLVHQGTDTRGLSHVRLWLPEPKSQRSSRHFCSIKGNEILPKSLAPYRLWLD